MPRRGTPAHKFTPLFFADARKRIPPRVEKGPKPPFFKTVTCAAHMTPDRACILARPYTVLGHHRSLRRLYRAARAAEWKEVSKSGARGRRRVVKERGGTDASSEPDWLALAEMFFWRKPPRMPSLAPRPAWFFHRSEEPLDAAARLAKQQQQQQQVS